MQNVLYRRNFCTNIPYYIPYNPLVAAAFFGPVISKPDYNYEFAGLMITFKTEIEEKTPGKSSPKTELKVIELMMDNDQGDVYEKVL